MWILLSNKQQKDVKKLSKWLWVSSFGHNQTNVWDEWRQIIKCGRTSHLATGVHAAKSFSVTQCCHLWASRGIALSLSPQLSPWWPRMLSSLTGGPSLSSTERWRSSRSTPAQLKQMFSSLPEFKYSSSPEKQQPKTQDEPVTTSTTNRPDSVATTPSH